ncbi:hypothetical protein JEY40_31700 [Bradyrhizobium japonicum]|uniref:hypothetical protein n=1 Tax=Bradyrhizobium japonicum TaxID=375 RepID=UPI00200D224E|nr:hypothetical protein [Bradyrhizobium japonicum]UQD70489.1 hypothetical protein JEY40_31700 [Bradyrhizobium japonicum]
MRRVDDARAAADVVPVAGARIGEKIAKVPKAVGGDQNSKLPRKVNSKYSRTDVMPSGMSRAPCYKLAAAKR